MERIRTQVRVVEVGPEEDGRKLLSFLEARLGRLPSGLYMRLVRSGQIRLDGRRCKPFDRVQAGQKVRIPPVEVERKEETLPRGNLSIVHEDGDMLVIDKPAGLPVHPGTGWTDSVHGRLDAWQPRPIPVHRLDRDTSGLLLCAKTHRFLRSMHSVWHMVTKAYVCWVEGLWPHGSWHTVISELGKTGTPRGERMCSGHGRRAVSHVHPLRKKDGRTLLAVVLGTGRTHQIRVHLADSGHPIVGDAKYGRGQGLLLHAAVLRWPGHSFSALPEWPGPFAPERGCEEEIFSLLAENFPGREDI